jgi:hypothetical protein
MPCFGYFNHAAATSVNVNVGLQPRKRLDARKLKGSAMLNTAFVCRKCGDGKYPCLVILYGLSIDPPESCLYHVKGFSWEEIADQEAIERAAAACGVGPNGPSAIQRLAPQIDVSDNPQPLSAAASNTSQRETAKPFKCTRESTLCHYPGRNCKECYFLQPA